MKGQMSSISLQRLNKPFCSKFQGGIERKNRLLKKTGVYNGWNIVSSTTKISRLVRITKDNYDNSSPRTFRQFFSFYNHFNPCKAIKPLQCKQLLGGKQYEEKKTLFKGENNKRTGLMKTDGNDWYYISI